MDDNIKKCVYCNNFNKNDALYCTNCGSKFTNQSNIINNEEVKTETECDEQKQGNKLAIISLILYLVIPAISVETFLKVSNSNNIISAIESLTSLCPLAGIITIIYGRIKYPKNKFLKGLMWFIIGSIIFLLVIFIIFTVWCYITCANMDTSGCA